MPTTFREPHSVSTTAIPMPGFEEKFYRQRHINECLASVFVLSEPAHVYTKRQKTDPWWTTKQPATSKGTGVSLRQPSRLPVSSLGESSGHISIRLDEEEAPYSPTELSIGWFSAAYVTACRESLTECATVASKAELWGDTTRPLRIPPMLVERVKDLVTGASMFVRFALKDKVNANQSLASYLLCVGTKPQTIAIAKGPPAPAKGPEEVVVGTPAWDLLTERRAVLIKKKNREGLTAPEIEEFTRLQEMSRKAVRRKFPLPRLVAEERAALDDAHGQAEGSPKQ